MLKDKDRPMLGEAKIHKQSPYLVEVRQDVVGEHLPPVRVPGELQAHRAVLAGLLDLETSCQRRWVQGIASSDI